MYYVSEREIECVCMCACFFEYFFVGGGKVGGRLILDTRGSDLQYLI